MQTSDGLQSKRLIPPRSKKAKGIAVHAKSSAPEEQPTKKATSITKAITAAFQSRNSPASVEKSCHLQQDDYAKQRSDDNILPSSRKDCLTPIGSARKGKRIATSGTRHDDVAGLSKSTTKPRRDREIALASSCRLPPNHPVDYYAIVGKLSHEAFGFNGNVSPEFPFNTSKFKHVSLDRSSYLRLTRDPEEYTDSPRNLYCDSSLINFYNQFTYRGENSSTDECKFILTRSELIDSLKGQISLQKNSILRDLLGDDCGKALLEATCIDITIHGKDHFSKAWIMNPQDVIQRTYLKNNDETPRASILVANSLPDCGGTDHDPQEIAKKLRRFINCLDKTYNKSGGVNFTVNTIPLQILEGKFVVLCPLKC